MKWGVTKVKHPNKGHTLNKGQKPMYQGVRYSESPLYMYTIIQFDIPNYTVYYQIAIYFMYQIRVKLSILYKICKLDKFDILLLMIILIIQWYSLSKYYLINV